MRILTLRTSTAALAAVLGILLRLASAATIVVPDDQRTIGAAVAVAGVGDTIRVRSGTYAESVVIAGEGKDGLTLEGLNGRPRVTPVSERDGIRVQAARRVTIRGLDVEGGVSGVHLRDASDVRVIDVHVVASAHGIRIHRCTPDCEVSDSSVTRASPGPGIQVRHSAGVAVIGNFVSESSREGIYISRSDDLSLQENRVVWSGTDGIRVSRCDGVAALEGNEMRANGGSGLRLENGYLSGACPSCGVGDNTADGNRRYGFRVRGWARLSSPADLTDLGNSATQNLVTNFRVLP